MKILNKFNIMNPEIPEYTDKNHMYSLSNVDPLYYLAEGGQEKQATPLVASRVFQQLSTTFLTPGSAVTSIIPSQTINVHDIFAAFGDGSVFGVRINTDNTGAILSTSTTQQGLVFGGGYGNSGYVNKVVVFADKLVGFRGSDTGPSGGNIAYTTITSSTNVNSWTGYSENNSTNPFFFITAPEAVVFGAKLWVTDAYQKNTMSSIRGFQSSGSSINQDTSLVLSVPDNFSILKLANFRNKWLVAAGVYNSLKAPIAPGTVVQNSRNYLFFFNGSGPTYQYVIQLPGAFADMIIVEDDLKVLLQNKFRQYSTYKTNSDRLVLESVVQIDTPKSSPLFSYLGMLGINLNTKGIYVQGNTISGLSKYIYTTNNFAGITASTLNSRLYAYDSSNNFYCQQVVGNSYNDIDATSQWIPMDTTSTSVKVWYDSPPSTTGEYIQITATSYGEDQFDSVNQQVLNQITSTVFDNKANTNIDLKGLTGSMLNLRIQTHSLSSWRPIIRKVELPEIETTKSEK